MKENQQSEKILSLEIENKILKKRLNLIALITNQFLDTDQKKEIFNFLQSAEKIDDAKDIPIFTGHTSIYITTAPYILTEKEMLSKK